VAEGTRWGNRDPKPKKFGGRRIADPQAAKSGPVTVRKIDEKPQEVAKE
jgi:hypothetical protein